MADFTMRLPARKSAMSLLAKLDHRSHYEFTGELLDALWDAYDDGELPEGVMVLLRDWTARAHFLDSPSVSDRLREALRANAR